VGTASTTFSQLFSVACQFAGLDLLSDGSIEWNVVTSVSGYQNFGYKAMPDHDFRYRRATEFVQVVQALWDSWAPDAIVSDRARGVWAESDRVHDIDHVGEFFTVKGPLNMPRSPQGRPIHRAGGTITGRHRARSVGGRRNLYGSAGPGKIDRVLRRVQEDRARQGARPREGEDPARNHDMAENLTLGGVMVELSRAVGHRWMIGTPNMIADSMIEWFDHRACDGFNLNPPSVPDGMNSMLTLLVPELQERGYFQHEYKGDTLRERIGAELSWTHSPY
jgi:N-acetyl-S-(2-succino)cysteine monooxygenase